MATPILQVITEYCEGYVDDVRLEETRAADPALYLRQTWFFLRIAVSLFTRPAEMADYLTLTEPSFGAAQVTLVEAAEGSAVLSPGAEYAGYDLASCRRAETGPDGVISYYAVPFSYDAESGDVTVTGNFPAGTVFDMDFATDGRFHNTLTPEMMDILGTAYGLAWRERFNNDWLSMVSKPEDKIFREQPRAADKRANKDQIEAMRVSLAGKMRRFEQGVYYRRFVPAAGRINIQGD